MHADLVCAVDVGTSGVKAALVSVADGTFVSSGSRECQVLHRPDGGIEQSAEAVGAATLEAIAEAMRAIEPHRVGAVTVSGQRATFIALDADCRPLTEWISWQDHRGEAQCDALRDSVGEDAFYRITGLAIEPTAAISKIMWLRENRPDVFIAARYFVSHQSFILLTLGASQVVCSPSDASYLGVCDIGKRWWSELLCAIVGVGADGLGGIQEAGTKVGAVSAAVSAATGLLAGTDLVLGGGDLQCGALGVGADRSGSISMGLGTGGNCVAYLSDTRFHPTRAVSCQAHVIPGVWEMEGIALATASSFRWLAEELGGLESIAAAHSGRVVYDVLTELAEKVPAGSDGLLVIPALNGAGSPNWEPAFRGTVLGLSLRHDRATLFRAFIEGIAYEQRAMLDAMTELGIDASDIRLWGGPARSAMWCQLMADVFGRPVVAAATVDAGLVGAAILAAIGIGVHADVEAAVAAMVKPGRSYQPNAQNVTVYDRGYRRYLNAVSAILQAGLYRNDSF